MKVLSVDPGYDRLGVAILEKKKQQEKVLYSGCFQTDPKKDLGDRIFLIGEEIERIIKEYDPKYLSIEKVYFNKNQKTAMAVSEVRGVIIYKAMKSGLKVKEFSPQEIKVAVTGYGKSDKKQVAEMVNALLKIKKEGVLDDEYDALAAGITFFAHYRKLG